MIRPAAEINVMLNLLSRYKRDLYPMYPWHYSRYFNRQDVPIVKTERNKYGDISIVYVEKQVAIKYLKDQYGFLTQKEAEKEIRDVRAHHNL